MSLQSLYIANRGVNYESILKYLTFLRFNYLIMTVLQPEGLLKLKMELLCMHRFVRCYISFIGKPYQDACFFSTNKDIHEHSSFLEQFVLPVMYLTSGPVII